MLAFVKVLFLCIFKIRLYPSPPPTTITTTVVLTLTFPHPFCALLHEYLKAEEKLVFLMAFSEPLPRPQAGALGGCLLAGCGLLGCLLKKAQTL